MQEKGERGRVRWQPVVLVILFLGPLIAAWLLYSGPSGWRPGGSTNHGVLIDPPVLVPDLEMTLADVTVAVSDSPSLRDIWTMMYIDGGGCDARCMEALYRSRQVRLSLGRRAARVQRVYVALGDVPDPEWISAEHEDLLIVDATLDSHRDLIDSFRGDVRPEGDDIYLIDPLGNLMMRFPLEGDAKGMLEDLKRLLRLSRIG